MTVRNGSRSRPRAVWLLLGLVCVAGTAARAELLAGDLSLDALRRRFAAMRAVSLPVDAPVEWQFAFAGADPRALEALSVSLVSEGYRIVALRSTAEAGSLRVARVEQHTPITLERRNGELRAAASRYPGAAYEGAEPSAPR